MIGDYVDEVLLGQDLADNYVQIKNDAAKRYENQVKACANSLDELVDEFSEIIESLKLKLSEEVNIKCEALSRAIDDFVQRRDKFLSENELSLFLKEGTGNLRLFVHNGLKESTSSQRIVLMDSFKEIHETLNESWNIGLQSSVDKGRSMLAEISEAISNSFIKLSGKLSTMHYDIRFSLFNKHKEITISEDGKLAHVKGGIRSYKYVLADLELMKVPVCLEWTIKIESTEYCEVGVGICRSSIAKQGDGFSQWLTSGQMTIVHNIGYCFFDSNGATIQHGLNIENEPLKISFDPKEGLLTFNSRDKVFKTKVKNEQDLVPFFIFHHGSASIRLLETKVL